MDIEAGHPLATKNQILGALPATLLYRPLYLPGFRAALSPGYAPCERRELQTAVCRSGWYGGGQRRSQRCECLPLSTIAFATTLNLRQSILAACIQWLLPDLAAVAPARGVKPGPQPRRRKAHRRRSSLPVNLTPMQIAPTPRSRHRHSIAVAPSLPQTPIHNPNRRVYFADSPRSVTFQLPVSEESSPLPAVFNPIANCNLSGSPESSSSTLVCATTSPPANRRISQIKEGVEPTLDSGPLAKRFPPLRLPKFMDVKRRRVSSREENSSNVVPVDSNDAAPGNHDTRFIPIPLY